MQISCESIVLFYADNYFCMTLCLRYSLYIFLQREKVKQSEQILNFSANIWRKKYFKNILGKQVHVTYLHLGCKSDNRYCLFSKLFLILNNKIVLRKNIFYTILTEFFDILKKFVYSKSAFLKAKIVKIYIKQFKKGNFIKYLKKYREKIE